MSHTVKTKIEFKNTTALGKAVEWMKGTCLGNGRYSLYNSNEQGFGFKLPGWRYPLVAKSDNTLAYDDYNGSWGNRADIQKLQGRYALEAGAQAAREANYQCEIQGDRLIVFHSDGGELIVTGTEGQEVKVDAQNFHGIGCKSAVEAISKAIGTEVSSEQKPAYFEAEQTISVEGV